MRNDKYYENPKTYNEFKHNQNVAELKLKNAEKKLDEIQTVKGRLIIETKSGMEPADIGRYKRLGLKEIQTKKEIKFWKDEIKKYNLRTEFARKLEQKKKMFGGGTFKDTTSFSNIKLKSKNNQNKNYIKK